MKPNDGHINRTSFTSTPAHTAKKLIWMVLVVLASVVGLLFWAILKPILRGAGWLISIATAILILFWLLTL